MIIYSQAGNIYTSHPWARHGQNYFWRLTILSSLKKLEKLSPTRPIGRTPNIANHVFRHLKNIYQLKLFFFTSIQLTNMSGDPQVEFLFEKYFNLGDPFFVMYNVFREFYLISPTALIMNDLHLSLYMTKKGSDDVKYFLPKKRQK